MTEKARYQCKDCGDRFEVQILTEREQRQAQQDQRPVAAIRCPKCGGRNLHRI